VRALTTRQDEKPRVVDDQIELRPLGRFVPTHVLVARPIAQRRGSPAQQGDQLAVDMGHVAQRFAHQRGITEVVESLHVRAPAQQLVWADGPHHQRRARAWAR
jgi:hypothetical protein